jgi:hypothetical protein
MPFGLVGFCRTSALPTPLPSDQNPKKADEGDMFLIFPDGVLGLEIHITYSPDEDLPPLQQKT